MKMRNLMLAGAMALALAVCSSGPEDVAKKFAEAVTHNKYEDAEKYGTDQTNAMIELARQMGKPLNDGHPPKSIKVVKSDVNGDIGTVILDIDGHKEKIPVMKVDGDWKVNMQK